MQGNSTSEQAHNPHHNRTDHVPKYCEGGTGKENEPEAVAGPRKQSAPEGLLEALGAVLPQSPKAVANRELHSSDDSCLEVQFHPGPYWWRWRWRVLLLLLWDRINRRIAKYVFSALSYPFDGLGNGPCANLQEYPLKRGIEVWA
jgi:hypothetical protein